MVEARRSPRRGDPFIADARTSLVKGDFEPARELLRGEPDLDVEARLFGVAAHPDLEPTLTRWQQDRPDEPVLHLLQALHRFDQLLWLVTELEQQRDQQQQWLDEVESLWLAVEHVKAVTDTPIDGPLVRVALAVLCGALATRHALPVEDFDVCAKDAASAFPDSLQLARWTIQVAEVRDDQDALEIAERDAAIWPEGDPRHGEVATALIGPYLDILATGDQDKAQQYWTRASVSQSLETASEHFGEPTSAPSSADASNLFAFVLPRTHEPRKATTYFKRVQGELLTWPWALLRSPALAYRELEERTQTGILSRLFSKH